MSTVNWPALFPPQCPPSDANDASTEVFRIVSSNPPSIVDFQSYAQMYPDTYKGNCKASGLSVFTAKADALRLKRRVPGIGNLIASAKLSPEAGKMMPSPSNGNSHHTWWAPADFDHAAVFKVVS